MKINHYYDVDRRGSRVSVEAAAAISAGLTRLLSRGLESMSPRSQYPTEEAMSGRIFVTADPPTFSERPRKFTSPVRNFESVTDEDEHQQVKTLEQEFSPNNEFIEEDTEAPPSLQEPPLSLSNDDSNDTSIFCLSFFL